MDEKIAYFFASLDSNLMAGLTPQGALEATVYEYQSVYDLYPPAKLNSINKDQVV